MQIKYKQGEFNMINTRTPIAIALLSAFALTGCGGGEDEESSSNDNQNTTPKTVFLSLDKSKKITEPESGILSSFAQVSLSGTHSEDVTFNYSFKSVNAKIGEDYNAIDGTGKIVKGGRTFDIPFEILGDALDENDEVFTITISDPVNAEIKTAQETASITIIDEDEDAAISFETDFVTVIEGAGVYNVKVKLTTATEKDVVIPFSLSGLATRNSDYNLLSQSPVTVPAGADEVLIKFEVLEDDKPEGGEGIDIKLETPTNALVGKIPQITLFIPGDLGLNDTGATTFFDGNSYSALSESSDYPGQDASYGRDAVENAQFDGHFGFSLTKLDISGNALASNAQNFECIQDNQTGLIWEKKQEAQDLSDFSGKTARQIRDYINDALKGGTYSNYGAHENWRATNYSYYWYNTDKKSNGGSAGSQGDRFANAKYPINAMCAYPHENLPNYSGEATHCNTDTYKKIIDSNALCGFKDWRLPTTAELKSINNYNVAESLVIESSYFINTSDGEYITSDPSADGIGAAWCIATQTGETRLCKKQLPSKVRMVRGGAL